MHSPNADDWRVSGQEKYLLGAVLTRQKYHAPRIGWDHDHCDFCWSKFSESTAEDTLQEGYTTSDKSHWICPQCFSDFRDSFEFRLDQGDSSQK